MVNQWYGESNSDTSSVLTSFLKNVSSVHLENMCVCVSSFGAEQPCEYLAQLMYQRMIYPIVSRLQLADDRTLTSSSFKAFCVPISAIDA